MAQPGIIVNTDDQKVPRDNSLLQNRQLQFIYSRENLGLNLRTIDFNTTAARKILDNRDAAILADATLGVVAITLAPASTWGTTKTPVIIIRRIDNVFGMTYQPSAGDTINGIAGAVGIGAFGIVRLISNGVNGYWTI